MPRIGAEFERASGDGSWPRDRSRDLFLRRLAAVTPQVAEHLRGLLEHEAAHRAEIETLAVALNAAPDGQLSGTETKDGT